MGDILETVLIVDDDPALLELLQHALPRAWTQPPLRVLTAATLADALVLLGQMPIDLVVLDLLLPGSNGLAAVQTILHAMQTTLGRLLPVVVISGYLSDTIEEQALRVGMQACVQKGNLDFPTRLAVAMRSSWARHSYIEERLRLLREASADG